jgi:hypothetical protein
VRVKAKNFLFISFPPSIQNISRLTDIDHP